MLKTKICACRLQTSLFFILRNISFIFFSFSTLENQRLLYYAYGYEHLLSKKAASGLSFGVIHFHYLYSTSVKPLQSVRKRSSFFF